MTTCLPTLCAAGPTDPTRAEAKGGFTWWYADLVDARGDGLVVIVALGLPFLPGYASAAREGRAPAAVERPSVCVAHVQGGRLAFWALHETDPARVVWEPKRALLGDNALRVGVDGGASLRAALGGELPGAQWSLALEVDGPLRRSSPGEPDRAEHEWSVLTAVARGRARLVVGDAETVIEGRAYVDRNAGSGSLEALDVARWSWGRLAFPGRERIWYEATDTSGAHRSMALTVGRDGSTVLERDAVTTRGRRYGVWGLPAPAAVEVGGLNVGMPSPLDDSPFYARFRVDAEERGQVGRGFAEVCVPSRIDSAWFRPLLAMTVCRDARREENSFWLPLFGGPREGRFQRLVGAR